MQTSTQWWNCIKNDEQAIKDWLVKQYHGETTAAQRMEALLLDESVYLRPAQLVTLDVIAKQEAEHASWIGGLLSVRGIEPEVLKDRQERYWDETLGDEQHTADQLFAIAAHAEEMRLERIRVITNDEDAPADIRHVFGKILKDEEFHARAFKHNTSIKEYDAAKSNHEAGMKALGLVI